MALAVTTAFSVILCVSYGLATPESLHMHAFLEQVLPGFKWLAPSGFLVGLAESFLYGAYAGIVCVPVHRHCCGLRDEGKKRCENPEGACNVAFEEPGAPDNGESR